MGSLNPWGLLAGLSIIPIIYLYFVKQEKTLLEVSSLIPWMRMEEDRTSSSERFSLDLLLLLQILVLLMLMLMLVRIYYLDTVKVNHRVIIMDVSASMNAREPEGVSRLDKAREAAIAMIDKIGSDDRVMVIRMSAVPEKLSEFISDKSRLKTFIESVRPADTQANFRAALSLALSGIQGLDGGKVFVFGDRSPDSDEVHHLLGGIENAEAKIIFHTVGSADDNVAITALDVYQSVYKNVKKKIFITVRNYSSKIKKPVLNVFIGGKLVYRDQVTLHPDNYKILSFGKIEETGLLKVDLDDTDVLMSDNTAYGIVRGGDVARLLLVAESEWLVNDIERICKAAKSVNVTTIFPGEFSDTDLNDYDIAIFHGNTPEKMPAINSIFIAPPSESAIFEVSPDLVENPLILDWNRKHPMLKFLNFLDTIPLKESYKVSLPLWADELIITHDFPLAFWGIYQNHKRVVFSFDLGKQLFPSSQEITGLILFLNLIDWMVPGEIDLQEIRTGEKYVLEADKGFEEVNVERPDGSLVELKKEGDRFVFSDTEQMGVYRVEITKKDGSMLVRRFFTNLLSESESRITPAKPTEISSTLATISKGARQKQQYEIWRYLLIVAFIFLLAEWWVYFQRVE